MVFIEIFYSPPASVDNVEDHRFSVVS